jgi:hypothetical protein
MTELERALVALGQEVDFPPEPDLVRAVRERLERRRLVFVPRRRAVVLAVALLVVAFGIAMAVPPARSAILRFFHIGAVTVERVETLPAAEERPLAAGLGPALSQREAEERAGRPMFLPSSGERPVRFYARPGLVATILRWHSRPVLLAEITGDQVTVSKKFASPETEIEPAQIGDFGLWIKGGEHVLRWEFGDGEQQQIDTRLAGNVLIWLVGDTTFRLEGDLDKGQMLELAREITR